MESLAKFSATNKINPHEFDLTVNALLIGLEAEKYIPIFKKHNIGQCTLTELTDEDLIQLGVDDAEIRSKIINEVKSLPIYEENERIDVNCKLKLSEIIEVLEESSQHLYRIYLSVLANTLTVKKTKKISDCLLYKDKYASDISLATLREINTILNSIDIAVHTKFKVHSESKSNFKMKKFVVGTIGSITVALLTVMFIDSLRKLKV